MKGQITPKKQPLEVDCSNCKFKCNEHFSLEKRTMVCNQYWRLADVSRQHSFLCSLVEERAVKRHRREAISTKSKSRFYYLRCDSGELKRVCLRFICATFSISSMVITLALAKSNGGRFSAGPLDRNVRKSSRNTCPTKAVDIKAMPLLEHAPSRFETLLLPTYQSTDKYNEHL